MSNYLRSFYLLLNNFGGFIYKHSIQLKLLLLISIDLNELRYKDLYCLKIVYQIMQSIAKKLVNLRDTFSFPSRCRQKLMGNNYQ